MRQVKAGQLPLGKFTFALLLSLARVGERFQSAILTHLVSCIKEAFELSAWKASSPWLAQATKGLAPLRPEALLAATTRTSGTASFDHLVPSLIDLAASLLDTPPPQAKGGFGKAKAGSSSELWPWALARELRSTRLRRTWP